MATEISVQPKSVEEAVQVLAKWIEDCDESEPPQEGSFARARAKAALALVHRELWERGARPAGPTQLLDAPVQMLLTCPSCGERHVDEGEFATKAHHTHACQSCGMVWRPAIGATVGVRFLPGFRNP